MRVDVLDPAAFTPPYDHALCAALARAGAQVRLVTGPFRHGPLPRADGFARVVRPRWRHVLAPADPRPAVRHFQWLPLQEVDRHLVRLVRRPWVLTAHDGLPREPRSARHTRAQAALLRAADAVVVHSEHGAAALRALGVRDPRVIPHGPLDPGPPGALPRELRDDGRPVVLLFGLLRPYKGLDVLLEAWPEVGHAQLWVVGAPRMPLPDALPDGVQLVPRFVADGEASALLQRADVVVLPYREIDQSGVLFSALHAGRPLVLSEVGGLPEVGAGVLVPPGDPAALGSVLRRVVADPEERDRLAGASRAAAARLAWDGIARAHLDLYASLSGRPSP